MGHPCLGFWCAEGIDSMMANRDCAVTPEVLQREVCTMNAMDKAVDKRSLKWKRDCNKTETSSTASVI